MARSAVFVAILAACLAGSTRASACLVATQDVRVLLGESKEGLVWAVLELVRGEDEDESGRFWWKLAGRVELLAREGGGTTVLPHLGALSKTFKSRHGRFAALYYPPIAGYRDSLAGRIKLPGFHRPKAIRRFGCDYARACGPWRLEIEGHSLVARNGEMVKQAISIPTKLASSFETDEKAIPAAMANLRKELRLVAITEYELDSARAVVLNLATGDYRNTYGEDEPPESVEPSPMTLIRECQGTRCYSPAMTLHHGNHLEASIVLPPR
jgi:hypothetical protein